MLSFFGSYDVLCSVYSCVHPLIVFCPTHPSHPWFEVDFPWFSSVFNISSFVSWRFTWFTTKKNESLGFSSGCSLGPSWFHQGAVSPPCLDFCVVELGTYRKRADVLPAAQSQQQLRTFQQKCCGACLWLIWLSEMPWNACDICDWVYESQVKIPWTMNIPENSSVLREAIHFLLLPTLGALRSWRTRPYRSYSTAKICRRLGASRCVSVRLGAQADRPRNTSGPSTSDSSATIWSQRLPELPELHEWCLNCMKFPAPGRVWALHRCTHLTSSRLESMPLTPVKALIWNKAISADPNLQQGRSEKRVQEESWQRTRKLHGPTSQHGPSFSGHHCRNMLQHCSIKAERQRGRERMQK